MLTAQESRGVCGIKMDRELQSREFGHAWFHEDHEGVSRTSIQPTSISPIVGLYGNESEDGIDRLGFITLDTECQRNVAEDEEIQRLAASVEGKGMSSFAIILLICILLILAFALIFVMLRKKCAAKEGKTPEEKTKALKSKFSAPR